VTEDRRLSKPAGAAITTALGENTLWLSFISVWEIAKKVEKGQLVLDRAWHPTGSTPRARAYASSHPVSLDLSRTKPS
jgi:PIN domain nuclease of toxin-antitoxin system